MVSAPLRLPEELQAGAGGTLGVWIIVLTGKELQPLPRPMWIQITGEAAV